MTALVKQDDFTTALQDMEQTQIMCEKLLQTKHYQKMGPEGVYALVAKAKSLGISPLEALNGGLFFVNGKVGMSTETMAALIRQAGHSIVKDSKSNNDLCILHGKRKDNGDTWTVTFSMDDARRAGLAKNMYDKYPGIMCYNRACSMLARQLFPDVIKGCGYDLSELKEISNSQLSGNSVQLETFQVEEVKTQKYILEPAAFQIKQEPKVEVKKPTKDEVKALDDLLTECDPDFVKEKKEVLKSTFGSDDLNDMNSATYIRLLTLAKQNKIEYMKKVMGAEDDSEQVDE